jgi:O-antigen/teichoic acid export membrane protein
VKRSLNALLDQAASSASNVLALVLLARALDADTFGRFSLGYAVLVLVLSLTRAALGTRITLTPDHDHAHRVTAGVLGALTLLAVPTAAVVTGAGLLLTSGHDPALQLLVGLATPVVCAQDVLRFGAVAAGRPGVALVSDLSWLALVGVALLLRTDSRTTLLVWAGGAALALVVALVGLRTRPDTRAGRDLLVRLARREDPLAASLAANRDGSRQRRLRLRLPQPRPDPRAPRPRRRPPLLRARRPRPRRRHRALGDVPPAAAGQLGTHRVR